MLRPEECEPQLRVEDKDRPFQLRLQLRHGLQQASIVGHAQRAGLLHVGARFCRLLDDVRLQPRYSIAALCSCCKPASAGLAVCQQACLFCCDACC